MIKKTAITVIYLLTTLVLSNSYAQETAADPNPQNTQASQSIQDFKDYETKKKEELIRYARRHFVPLSFERNGKRIELNHIEGRLPTYKISHNYGSAVKISADKVWPGGVANTNLSGENENLAVWDQGIVRRSHQEFSNLDSRIIIGDDSSSLSDHASHVAGTMGASGVQSNAKGFSYKSSIHTYDWNNELSEMAASVAKGVRVANHSWGLANGWRSNDSFFTWYGDTSKSQSEDYKFGLYSETARSWDSLAQLNPYLTIVKSSGNDRSDTGIDGAHYHSDLNVYTDSHHNDGFDSGGYDTIDSISTAKNIITVGGIYAAPAKSYSNSSEVLMTDFSAWGPSDDGRIKPDIVAKGEGVFSTGALADNDYFTAEGTSMAAPAISGAIGLILEHFHKLNKGAELLSSSVKALLLHTADESGSNLGPDYQFGWGLANIYSAVSLITQNSLSQLLFEESLSNASVKERSIQSSEGIPLKVTLVWTDPPGKAENSFDSKTPNLVNDLDIRVIESNNPSNVFFPWTLDPDNPNKAAETGDNILDNVEQIYIPNPGNKSYTVTVSHKNTLANPQQYSLIIEAEAIGASSSSDQDDSIKITDALAGPNPANPDNPITIQYTLNSSANVSLYIFSINGTPIHQEQFSAGSKGGNEGSNPIQWDAKGLNLANGVYIAYIVATNGSVTSSEKVKIAILR